MPFDNSGNWHEDPEPDNDWSKPFDSSTKDNALFGIKMFFILLALVAVIGAGILVDSMLYYTIGKELIETGEGD